jgi:selenocysteine-specific elongation factor
VHVIATAGHVDHGKSMLVRALTGMEPDRWAEEQRRGMTIDLGFAWMTLPSGDQVAFVDVPGHERFVTNMLAGAGPAPAVMFVVAADEGWKPQSAEHVAAIDALGVRDGILVITRGDLADPAPALHEAMSKVAGTSLGRGGGLEAVTVSALTGQGIPGLVGALGRLTARLARPDPGDGVRLWLDRVFAIKGSGTVVTGTLQAGTVGAGDELVLTPSMRRLRVRSVQSLGSSAAKVSGVARVALNLRGVSTRELSRGMALVHAGRWTMTSVIDVRLMPPGTAPGQSWAEVALPSRLTLHIGAARTVARVRALGSGFARLSLDHPLPLHVGDRVLLRDPGAAADRAAGRPIVGAIVLDVLPPRLRGSGAAAAARRELASWPERPAAPDLLRRHRLLRAAAVSAMGLRDLPQPASGEWLADPAHWQQLRRQLAEAVVAHAARDPLAPGLAVDAARAELSLPDRSLVIALAAQAADGGAGQPIDASGGYLRPGTAVSGQDDDGDRGQPYAAARPAAREAASARPAPARPATPALPPAVAAAVQSVLDGLAKTPFSAPDSDRLRQLGLDSRAAAAAERAGLLRRLSGNVVLGADAPGQAARILARLQQPFTAAEARQALQTTRRVVIPLLELLDREGVTRRLPDDRRIMRDGSADPVGARANGGR